MFDSLFAYPNVYAEIDLEMKAKALAKSNPQPASKRPSDGASSRP
jgi:hypothetical protein